MCDNPSKCFVSHGTTLFFLICIEIAYTIRSVMYKYNYIKKKISLDIG